MDAVSSGALGFEYTIEIFKPPQWLPKKLHNPRFLQFYDLVDQEAMHNIIPTEGLNHILSVVGNAGVQVVTWYVGLFEGNYTPVLADTAATFPVSAAECTVYSESVRQTWVEAAPSAGSITNSANKATFTMTATRTLFGAFLIANPVKGSTTPGTLLSAARFTTSKVVDSGDIARITAALTLTSS